MKFMILLIVCIDYLHADTTFLYDSNKEGFINWTLKKYPIGGGSSVAIPGNFTSQITIDFDDSSVNYYLITSPLLDVRPSWKFSMLIETFLDDTRSVESACTKCLHLKYEGSNRKTFEARSLPKFSYEDIKSFLVDANTVSRRRRDFWYFQVQIYTQEALKANIKHFNLTSFALTYINCPKIVRGLAFYNNTPAARSDDDKRIDEGTCVIHSERAGGYHELKRFCSKEGKPTFIGSCWCKEGYEDRGKSECKACANNQFRTINMKKQNETACQDCGKYSDAVESFTTCRCRENYFRFNNEAGRNVKDCYSYPKQPRNIYVTSASTSIYFKWSLPDHSGSLTQPLKYTLKCTTKPTLLCPVKSMINQTMEYNLTELFPYKEYTFALCSHNDVSLSNDHEATMKTKNSPKNCESLVARTKEGLPTSVINFRHESQIKSTNVHNFKWSPPLSTGSKEFKYKFKCDGMLAQELNGSKHDINVEIQTKEKTMTCSITPISAIGAGPSSSSGPFSVDSVDTGSSASIGLIVGISIAAVVIIILVIALILWYLRSKRTQPPIEIDEEMVLQLDPELVRRLLMNRTRNLYVGASLEIVDLNQDEPSYGQVPVTDYSYQYSKLTILGELGEGNFAKVFKAEVWDICGSTGKSIVAVKELHADSREIDKNDFERELAIMEDLEYHPNVVRLLGICPEPHRCMIVEYLPGGDLLSFLLKSRQYRNHSNNNNSKLRTAEGSYLSARDLLTFAWQICKGMIHISEHNICHRDLACRNILVGYNRVCKVADLGLARKLNNQGIYRRGKQAMLPVKWMPPESMIYGKSTNKSDIWSFGILLWELITIGGVPYPEHKSSEILKLLRQKYRMHKPDHCGEEIYSLMLDCWSEIDTDRPSFSQLAQCFNKMKNETTSRT